MFHLEKAHYIVDEMVANGFIVEVLLENAFVTVIS